MVRALQHERGAVAPTLIFQPLLRRWTFLLRWSCLLALAFRLLLHFGLRFWRGLRFGFGLALGHRLLGGHGGGLRYSSGAAVGQDDALQCSWFALRVDHDEVEAGAVEQRNQGFADGGRA